MDRRAFIKLTAISGTSAAIASCGVPDTQLIRFIPDEDIVPGQAIWKPGVCTLCASGCGLTVKVMDADADVVRDGQKGLQRILAAKKLEGGPAHPVNQGRLCARGQAGIQVTYHPDRITQPLKRVGERGTGTYEAISWDAAIAELTTRLDALDAAGNQKALAWLGRADAGHRGTLIAQFLARVGGTGPIGFEAFGDDVLRRANALSFGHEQLPTFDLANARYVLSLGADFLGTWNSPVAQSLGYGAMRQGRRGIRGTFIQVESRMTQTGANADEWVPANPGTEGALALGLAHVILAAKLLPVEPAAHAGALIDGFADGLPAFAPDAVEALTGVAASRVERLARELVDLRPAVVIVGGAPLAHTNGLFTALAVNALNALLGSVEQPGGLRFTPQLNVAATAKLTGPVPARAPLAGAEPSPSAKATATAMPSPSLASLAAAMLAGGAGAPQVLIIDGLNPVFTAPPAWRVREGLTKVPTIVSVGSFLDETSAFADLILPDHSFLESWVDAVPESGSIVAVASVAPPVMRPLHNTRSTVDVLLEVSGKLQRPIAWPWQTYEEMLTASLSTLPPSTPDGDVWSEVQERGGWWGALPAAFLRGPSPQAVTPAATFAEPTFDGDPEQFPFHFLPYVSSTFLDGSLAHLPWLQEMPDPLTSAMWSTWVEINPVTASALGVADGDVVRVSSPHGALQAAVVVSPGVAPYLVAMPAGQGHTTFTRYASGRGANPLSLLAPVTEPATGALAWAATRVKIERVSGPDGRLILFAGGMREHEHDEPPHR